MKTAQVDVSARGAVILGGYVTCDGFVDKYPYRVQTHVHEDHMGEFGTSKGFQDIIMSIATRELLIAELDADIPYHANIHAIPLDSSLKADEFEIEIMSSGHMLGSAQVSVMTQGGSKVGYSGDFDWPLQKVINVEALVLDSTWGSPKSRRKYSWEEVSARFIELVLERIKVGPVVVKAQSGTLQCALEVLNGVLRYPILASARRISEAAVYRRFGYSIASITSIESEEGKLAMQEGRYLRIYGKGDHFPVDPCGSTVIILHAGKVSPDDPVVPWSETAYDVGLSCHADFEGTIQYVEATGATQVVTDNSRGPHAVELARALKKRLGIDARPSSNITCRDWGC